MHPGTDLSLTAFVNAQDFKAPGVDLVASRLPLQRPPARIVWEQSMLPVELRRRNVDLVHGLVNVLPLTAPTPGVVTVHDLSFVRTPEILPRFKRTYLARLCRLSVARARRVIAVSRQTADDLTTFFHVDPGKIDVIYNGVGTEFSPGDPLETDSFRRATGIAAAFSALPRHAGAAQKSRPARARLCPLAGQASEADQSVKLVLAGAKGWYYDQIFAAVREIWVSKTTCSFPASCPPRSWWIGIGPPRVLSIPVYLRALACRCWRPWPAGRRCFAAGPRACWRSPAAPH